MSRNDAAPGKHKQENENFACKCCGDYDIINVGKKNGYLFWKCQSCDFIFTDVGYKNMVETYESGYHSVEDGAPNTGWAPSLEFLSPAFLLLPDRKLNVLDFGCGESYIPKKLRQSGHKVVGIDLVPPVEEHSDRITGDILEVDMPVDNFNLIYSFQVFEHIAEPFPVMERLSGFLQENALLLIHTDMETEERYQGKFTDWWYVVPPDHCSYYTHKTFEKLFQKVGCQMIYKSPHVVLARKMSRTEKLEWDSIKSTTS
jgi:2-polyprenyl-3-methyl-5-hydroxy-6-metoxy-1,4-benzoquinol methylase